MFCIPNMTFVSKKFKLRKIRDSVYNLVRKENNDVVPCVIAKKHETVDGAIREGKLLQQLQDINGIPQFIARQGPYVIMTKFDGEDLFELILKRKFPEWEVRIIVKQILYILKEMHEQNVFHRDLKLENVVYDEESHIVGLVDFDQRVTTDYMPPEAIDHGLFSSATEAADMWGIGIICYMLVQRTYAFKNKEHVKTKPPYRITKQVSQDCKDFIKVCLDKNPVTRLDLQGALCHPWLR